ncbi:DUF6510 family protein [Nocardia sp. NPDC005978]|uniref:DUF6510 family protein n=1 Tax=Nocardia sp. NPDC005978 TaxID=3156725 RepID=UPI0033AB84CF
MSADATSAPGHLDGNVLAGLLAEIFTVDPVAHGCRCGCCGAVEPLARALVYLNCPGTVARCSHCSAVVLRLTVTPAGRWLDLGEGASLCLPIPEG